MSRCQDSVSILQINLVFWVQLTLLPYFPLPNFLCHFCTLISLWSIRGSHTNGLDSFEEQGMVKRWVVSFHLYNTLGIEENWYWLRAHIHFFQFSQHHHEVCTIITFILPGEMESLRIEDIACISQLVGGKEEVKSRSDWPQCSCSFLYIGWFSGDIYCPGVGKLPVVCWMAWVCCFPTMLCYFIL